MSEYAVTKERALEQLDVIPDYDPGDGPKPCVHTFVAGPMLLGAHWALTDVDALIDVYGVEQAGPAMSAMGHALVVVRPDASPLFLATKEATA